MKTLVLFAFVIASAVICLGIYLKSHPPDMSVASLRSLQRGLRLGAASSITVLLLYILYYFHPTVDERNLPFVLCAFAGNLVNLTAVVNCFRELTGESLFAACLLVFTQLLWMLYALLAIGGF
jgi:hypothetical protein